MFKKNLFLIIFLSFFLLSVSTALGAGILPNASGKACDAGDAAYCGNYELNDFVSLAIKVSQWILGIIGSLSLIMFIYGGFMFLISAGSSEAISKAKKIIVAAVVGLIIVFSSYLIIKFVMSSMGLSWDGTIGTDNRCDAIYGSQGYSCMNRTDGQNCRSGLCPGGADFLCCQQKQ